MIIKRMIKTALLILITLSLTFSFQVGIDFNTYSATELTEAVKLFGHVDFTWAITVNSPGVTPQQWSAAFAGLNKNTVYSQDNPMGFTECAAVRNYAGTLTAAFGYHQTGSTPATQLTAQQIDLYASKCGANVIILTRGYWPNTDWRARTDAVLHHPKLYGVAMEFGPHDYSKHYEVDFIHSVLAAGKVALFLLPFTNVAGNPTQKQITGLINYLKSSGVNLSDNRIKFVLARYDKPYIPIPGATNSIDSALKAAQRLK